MTVKEFRRCLRCGLGRCALVLDGADNIEKYRRAVLDCCLDNPSFDTQCEGTRAPYMYELVRRFNDDEYFLKPLIEKFKTAKLKSDWDFQHLSEIIMQFALDKNASASSALWDKYGELFDGLLKNEGDEAGSLKFCFESVCVSLTSVDGRSAFIKIANDMGRLFVEGICNADDFDWFYINYKEKGGDADSVLQNEESHFLKVFYDAMKRSAERLDGIGREKRPFTADRIIDAVYGNGGGALHYVGFGRRASDNEKLKLAEAVLSEDDPKIKAKLLRAFNCGGFPLSRGELISYTNSPDKQLQNAALAAVENCRSEEVRKYALKLIEENKNPKHALRTLIFNCEKDDEELVLKLLNSLKINYSDASGWHGAVLTVLNAFKAGVNLPKETLFFIYEKSLCSCCRESALAKMRERGWLTDEIKRECLYDCNWDIREFVKTL